MEWDRERVRSKQKRKTNEKGRKRRVAAGIDNMCPREEEKKKEGEGGNYLVASAASA